MELSIALAKAGMVAVPINFRLVTPEILYIVEHCHAKAIIAQDELAPQVEPLRGRLSIADKAWICIGDEPPAGWAAYEALVEHGTDRDPGRMRTRGDAVMRPRVNGGQGRCSVQRRHALTVPASRDK